jgi:hypothetical protein
MTKHKVTGDTSDGFHTFDELYEHRHLLFLSLAAAIEKIRIVSNPFGPKHVWRSEFHSDNELVFGGEWFVMGIFTQHGEQITYHLPMKYWKETQWVHTLSIAPDWDGHTSKDVAKRLKKLVKNYLKPQFKF